MRGYIQKIRPARSAIAAVLAMSSTYAFAQDVGEPAAATTAPTVIVPPTAIAVPASPQTIQPTETVDARIAAEQEAAERNAATALATNPPAAQQRTPARTARTQAVPTTAPAAERTVAEASPALPASPPQQRMTEPTPVAPAPLPTEAAADSSAAAMDWTLPAVLGGGALLLLGLSGAALIRRKRAVGEDAGFELPVHAADPAPAPITPQTIAPAPAPARSLTPGAAQGSLAAMVAAPPSAENPFRTHRKRMARARFLLARQERRVDAESTPARPAAPPQTIHAEPQMQTVYRLGGSQKRGIGFKPQTR